MGIIDWLEHWHMTEPKVYGFFHILFILIDIIATVLLIIFFRNSREKIMKRIVFIAWIILVFFEIGKQFLMSYSNETLNYNWGAFPFQFCETPLYAFPILLLNKNEKVRNALISFISTYVFFAGLAIMVNPSTVLTGNIFLCIRQMVEHGIQISIGLYLFAWNRKNANLKSFAWGALIFVISVIMAILLNVIIGNIVKQEINMFYLNKNYSSVIIILKDIQPHVPWIIFVLLYIVGFSGLALATYYLEVGIYSLYKRIKQNSEDKVKYQN